MQYNLVYIMKEPLKLTKANNWRKFGEVRVADALWYCECGSGDTSKKIILEQSKVIIWQPFEYGNEVFNHFPGSTRTWLVLQLVKWIIGKECFFTLGFEHSSKASTVFIYHLVMKFR